MPDICEKKIATCHTHDQYFSATNHIPASGINGDRNTASDMRRRTMDHLQVGIVENPNRVFGRVVEHNSIAGMVERRIRRRQEMLW